MLPNINAQMNKIIRILFLSAVLIAILGSIACHTSKPRARGCGCGMNENLNTRL